MADETGRELERAAAAGGAFEVAQLRHHRCRIGECCAHIETDREFPPMPSEARSAFVTLFRMDNANMEGLFPERLGEEDTLGEVTVSITLGGNRATLHAALLWLREAFRAWPQQNWGSFAAGDRSPPLTYDDMEAGRGGGGPAMLGLIASPPRRYLLTDEDRRVLQGLRERLASSPD
ncbi:MAG: hypothetical protein KAJ19_15315, partial [Gammaproteobacteria bacterium]|nr:hypothetical protein [Gammaproteobacteria bacterium]